MAEGPRSKRRALPRYTAPEEFFSEVQSIADDGSTAAAAESSTDALLRSRKTRDTRPIAQREDEYHRQWRKRTLSPPRADAFALASAAAAAVAGKATSSGKELPAAAAAERRRTYRTVLRERALEREEHELRAELAQRTAEAAADAAGANKTESEGEGEGYCCWQLSVLKGGATVEPQRSLAHGAVVRFGRDAAESDVVLAHPSCSSRHAKARVSAETGVRIVDLQSTNGTFLNGRRLEPGRYADVPDGAVVTFAASTREYVFMKRAR